VLSKTGHCLACGEFGRVKRQYLEKQHRVKEVVARKFKIESYDKVLDGGACSRKRPDIVIDGVYRKLVIEIDEFQHKRGRDYGPDCEYRRMWDITQALGMPTTFVRYNPDPFMDADGKRRDPAASEREAALEAWIKTLQERELLEGTYASVIYLYYDGFSIPEAAIEEAMIDPLTQFEVAPMRETRPMQLTDADIEELMFDLGLEA
jgi:hypothetical protein